MLELLCPDECRASVLDIDLASLRERGIRGLILDLDNTILGYGREQVAPAVDAWAAAACQAGFRLCITSNARSGRVRAAAGSLGIPFIAKAAKPWARPFRLAMAILHCAPEEAAVVGDQLFIDVLGGNRLGLYTVLINPLSRAELPTTRLIRRLEDVVITRLKDRGLLSERDWRIRLQRVGRVESQSGGPGMARDA